MLLALRNFIAREQTVSMQRLSREFNIDKKALEPMLAIWIARDIICRSEAHCKSSCLNCNSAVFYSYKSSPNQINDTI